MRERWFLVEGARRRGPLSLEQLVDAVRAAPDPGSVLVWCKGLRDWTRADSAPRVEGRLARVPPEREPVAAGSRGAVASVPPGGAPSRNAGRWLALAIGLLVLAGALWLARPRAGPRTGAVPPDVGGHEDAPAALLPSTPAALPSARATERPLGPGAGHPPRASDAAPIRVRDVEAELPASVLPELKGVAAWLGDTLRLTVYNGTNWRVTELRVRIERLAGDDFVEDPQPLALRMREEPVDASVADLLKRVAPDRRKRGLNALDTGVFEGRAGAQPEGLRWRIESARGYPPQR